MIDVPMLPGLAVLLAVWNPDPEMVYQDLSDYG